jgi:hypothetical protein
MSKRKVFDMGRGLVGAGLLHPWARLKSDELTERWHQASETFMREYLGTFVGVDPAVGEDRSYVTYRSIWTPAQPSDSEGVAYLLQMDDAQLEASVRRMVSEIPTMNFRCLPLHGMSPMQPTMVREGSTTACAECGVLVDTGAVYQSVKDANRLLCESCFHGAVRGGRARERKPVEPDPIWVEEPGQVWGYDP